MGPRPSRGGREALGAREDEAKEWEDEDGVEKTESEWMGPKDQSERTCQKGLRDQMDQNERWDRDEWER